MNRIIGSVGVTLLFLMFCTSRDKEPTGILDTKPPGVRIVYPFDNSRVGYATTINEGGSNVKIEIEAIDNEYGMDRVELFINFNLEATLTEPEDNKYTHIYDLFGIRDGRWLNLLAIAYDKEGNKAFTPYSFYKVLNWDYSQDTIDIQPSDSVDFYLYGEQGDSFSIYLELTNLMDSSNFIDRIEVWEKSNLIRVKDSCFKDSSAMEFSYPIDTIIVRVSNQEMGYNDTIYKKTGIKKR